MATLTINLKVKVSWWVKPYLFMVGFMCRAFNSEPNWEKVNYWLEKGITVKAGELVVKD